MPASKQPLSDEWNLKAVCPEIAEQWDYEANAPHRPEGFTPGSSKVFQWICPTHPDDPEHRWKAAIVTRRAGHGCAACAGKKVARTNSIAGQYPELAEEWHPTANGDLTPDKVITQSHEKIAWRCRLGHEWRATPNNRVSNNSNCPTCAKTGTSRIEIRVASELITLLPAAGVDWRKKVKGRECDVILTSLGIGIEVDGYYWHLNKHRQDAAKREALARSDIRLIRLRDERLHEDTGIPKHSDDVLFSHGEGDDHIMARLASRIGEICEDLGHGNVASTLRAYAGAVSLRGDALYLDMVENMGSPPSGRSFADVAPEAAAEWDKAANGALKATDFFPYSRYPAHWRCKTCNHRWRVSIGSRTSGNGCPACSGRVATPTNNLVALQPDVMRDWDEDRNTIDPTTLLPGSGEEVHWKCAKSHRWTARVHERTASPGCKTCRQADNSLLAKSPRIAAEWHPALNGNLTPSDVSYGSKTQAWWACEKGHVWEAKVNLRTSGHGCPYCAGKRVCLDNCLAMIRSDLAAQWIKAEKDGVTPYNVTKGSSERVEWGCARGHRWTAEVKSRVNGNGCPTCQDPLADVDLDTLPKTRSEAQRMRSKFYFTGKPCQRHGHIAPRWTGNKNCRECNRIRSMDHYARKKSAQG